MLLALEREVYEHHDHLYVDSVTGERGIIRRVEQRSQLAYLEDSPCSFPTLILNTKPQQQVRFQLLVINSSQREKDPVVRTRNRFLVFLAEAVFHDLLRLWKDPPKDEESAAALRIPGIPSDAGKPS